MLFRYARICFILMMVGGCTRGGLVGRKTPQPVMAMRDSGSAVLQLRFSSDNKKLVAYCENINSYEWDVQSRTYVGRSAKPPSLTYGGTFSQTGMPAASSDNRYEASTTGSNDILLTPRKTRTAVTLKFGDIAVLSVFFSSDSTKIAACGQTAGVRIWQVASGQKVCDLSLPDMADEPGESDPEFYIGTFTPDSTRVVIGVLSGKVTLWDLNQRQPIWAVKAHGHRVSALACSGDGRLLATGDTEGNVKVWHLPN